MRGANAKPEVKLIVDDPELRTVSPRLEYEGLPAVCAVETPGTKLSIPISVAVICGVVDGEGDVGAVELRMLRQ